MFATQTMQMNDQNKLTTQMKEQAKQLNELTNELVAASLFNSNLFNEIWNQTDFTLERA